MSTDLVATFESSLDALELTWSRTPHAEFEDALADVVVEPAVGAPFPFDEPSLPRFVESTPSPSQLKTASTGVTAVGVAVAAYGSIVIQSRPAGDEPVSLYPEQHVAVLRASDLVADLTDALGWLGEEFDAGRESAVLATGPSATADMGDLVRGVHGPREVHVVIVTDR